MAFRDQIKSLVAKLRGRSDPGFRFKNSGFGLYFLYPEGCKKGSLSRLPYSAHQYIILQMLLEAGSAEETDAPGCFVHVPNNIVCSLQDAECHILGLPPRWPGKFDCEAHGVSADPDFSLALYPMPKTGVPNVKLEAQRTGPFLLVDGQEYLLDSAQLDAIEAVEAHKRILPGQRTEEDNTTAIFLLQQAVRAGAQIDMHHLGTGGIEVIQPDHIGVIVEEVPDMGLVLTPNIPGAEYNDLLNVLAGNRNERHILRIGRKIVLLDEQRFDAVQEILSSRVISAKDKDQFFRTPNAYLNASLVDLDRDFAYRVHGMAEFRKAYFGEIESRHIGWFCDTGEEPSVFPLEYAKVFVETEEALAELEIAVDDAVCAKSPTVDFDGRTYLLPNTEKDCRTLLRAIREKIARSRSSGEDEDGQTSKGVVDIDLNDGVMSDAKSGQTHAYTGTLHEDELNFTPFDYQTEGVRWLVGLMPKTSGSRGARDNTYYGGLLADDMGLGKTFQVLAALNIRRHLLDEANRPRKPVLAVMPVVLLENWRHEVDAVFKNSPFTDVVILQADGDLPRFRKEGASSETRQKGFSGAPSQIRYSLKIGPEFGTNRLDLPGRLVLTNYETLRDYQFSLCLVDWDCVIFDEAQEIKNPNTIKSRAARGLKAGFRLAMTGTPVENSLRDFWSIYDTVKPGLLGSYQAFQKRYIAPVVKEEDPIEALVLQDSLGQELRKKVDNFLLRRTKEDHLEGLPMKIIHDGMEDLRYRKVMDGEQLEIYSSIVSAVASSRQTRSREDWRKMLLPGIANLRQVSLHPDLLQGKELPLVQTWTEAETALNRSAKLRLLIEILEEIRSREEKVIVFVINRALQAFLATVLQMRYNMPVCVINGETPSVASKRTGTRKTRLEMIRRFEEKPGFNIICMSPLATGVGLTITGANNVIHLERHWNPAKEAQATDRVYRIGATKDVHVYIPILGHPGLLSFDENLNNLLQKKKDLKDSVMIETEIGVDNFDTDKLFGLSEQYNTSE